MGCIFVANSRLWDWLRSVWRNWSPNGYYQIRQKRKITAITPFKVIQGHRSSIPYRWKSVATFYMWITVTLTNLPHILHRFGDMEDYWSSFPCRRGAAVFYTLVGGEPLNLRLWKKNFVAWNYHEVQSIFRS